MVAKPQPGPRLKENPRRAKPVVWKRFLVDRQLFECREHADSHPRRLFWGSVQEGAGEQLLFSDEADCRISLVGETGCLNQED